MILTYSILCLSVLLLCAFFYGIYQKKRFLLEHQSKRIFELEKTLKEKEIEVERLKQKNISAEEKISLIQELENSFKALSSDALLRNNQAFLDLAKTTLEKFQIQAKHELEGKKESIANLILPVKETLTKLDLGLQNLEKERKSDFASLRSQVGMLIDMENQLRKETGNLVKALRSPIQRGRWGEIQLRRVVELAGMLNHCDFFEQQHNRTDEILRPDLIIKLPGERQVIVDAKVPLDAYLDATAEEEETVKLQKLKHHARQLRAHVQELSKKSYWHHFQPTPEFVVLFLPSETVFGAALEHDPSLIEVGAEQGVILSTPTTLIALLKAISYGWRQESLSKHVEEVHLIGKDLYKRILDMTSHFAKLGRLLSGSVEAYNKTVGSMETRVLVTARKFKDLGAASSSLEMESLEVIEKSPRFEEIPEK